MSSFWNIEYEDGLLDRDSMPRKMVRMHAAATGLSQPKAVAELIEAGYAAMGGIVRNRGGGAAPRTAESRAGAAVLRVADRRKADGRQEQSGSKGKEAA
jgi:hypothetical protein